MQCYVRWGQHFNIQVTVASLVFTFLCRDTITIKYVSCLLCSVWGDDERDNTFTSRRWAEMEEAVRSRTEDMSKLELIGRPLLSDESHNSESEYVEQDESSNVDNETSDCECSS